MKIPVVDLKAQTADQIFEDKSIGGQVNTAFTDVGSLVIVGHDFPVAVLQQMQDRSMEFFNRSAEEKSRVARTLGPEVARGYLGIVDSVVTANMERFSFGDFDVDYQDAYYGSAVGRAHFPPNTFLEGDKGLEQAARTYLLEIRKLSQKVAALFENALQLQRGVLAELLKGGTGTATSALYPKCAELQLDESVENVRIQAHNDTDMWTILRIFGDGPTDLYYLDQSNEWHEVPRADNAFAINIGDTMQQFTNSHWLATSHKVLVPAKERRAFDRFSLPYFEHARYDAEISPLNSPLFSVEPCEQERLSVGEFEKQRRMMIQLDTGGDGANDQLLAPIEARLGS